MGPTQRINARLDESRSAKLEHLAKVTDLGVSEIVRRAIDLYYERLEAERPSAAEILKKTGFVGCAEGPGTLSSSYKDDLAVLLSEKHERR